MFKPSVRHLKLAGAFATSAAAYWTHGDARPFSATFAVTNRCNLRCDYCNFPYLDPHDLPLARVKLLLTRLRDLGASRLGLVGGEPLLRRDLPEIITSARSAGFFVMVNSNLTLYHRFPNALNGVDAVFTSLDGDVQAHEAHRGAGSADGVIASIRSLVAKKVPVTAICVVTDTNMESAPGLLDLADQEGIRIHFQPQCHDAEIVRGRSLITSNERHRAFWRSLAEAKSRGRRIASSRAYLEHLAAWDDFRISALRVPEQRCAAGRGFLFVDPQGMAYPCSYTKGKTRGVDLLREDWSRSWDGKTPCSVCSVGPLVEFNLLFNSPFRVALDLVDAYG